jgi:hypothetical protein
MNLLNTKEREQSMKKIKGFLLLGITMVMMFALTGCGKTTVKLDKYVTITTDGYDSMGTASYSFDYEAFEEDYSGKIKISNDTNTLFWRGTAEELLLNFCVSQQLDKTDGLSNGDVVTLKWICNEEMAEEYFNAKLVYSDITYTVTDLKEVDKFNPFDYVDISFSGTSPYGSVEITPDYDQAEIQYIKFSADKSSNIENGETITITASVSGSVTSFAEKFGSVLGETEKTYVCESLPYYLTDVNDISENDMNAMIAQGEDIYRTYVNENWGHPENMKSVLYAGNYFTKAKDGRQNNNNALYLIYEIQAYNSSEDQMVDFYYYVRFNNIQVSPDGTCSAESYYAPYYKTWYDYSGAYYVVGNFPYSGYGDLDSLVNDLIISNIDSYEYTTTFKQ